MKQYYIYLGTEQIGPLSFDELTGHKITTETMVWFEGLAEWQKANTLEELKPLFKALPPPLHKTVSAAVSPPPVQLSEPQYTPASYADDIEPRKILGLKKNIFVYAVLGLAFIICISAFSSISNDKEEVQTEQLNQKLLDQEKALEQQNERIAEQERLEKERVERERKIALKNRITEIAGQLTTAYQKLEKEKRHLDDVSAFKFLRSNSKRHEEISEAESKVTGWQNEITELETEMKKINPDWVDN